ncbi:MAG: type I restriction-modification system subunit M N-terminal domain-containing protein [Fervidobacterium sp.]
MIYDRFEQRYNRLVEDGEGFEEDRDEYEAENIFRVPKEARWERIKKSAKDPKIGQIIDDVILLTEKENPNLKSILVKRYARPELDKRRFGELIDLIPNIKLYQDGQKDIFRKSI